MVVDKVNRATVLKAPISSNPVNVEDMTAAPSQTIPDASPPAPSSHNPTHSLDNQLIGSSQPGLTSIASDSQSAAAEDPSSPTSGIAILVGLDGWHLTRAQLSAMPDPKLAFDRRGVHWTFDPNSYLEFVKDLREPVVPLPKDTARAQDGEEGRNEEDTTKAKVITAPSFDHAVKDPTPHAIHIFPNHRIVVIEGLYVLLSSHGWKEAAGLLDERWLVDVGVEEAKKRLVKRHVITGVAKDMEEAIWRADNNDMPSEWICFPSIRKARQAQSRWYLFVREYGPTDKEDQERRRSCILVSIPSSRMRPLRKSRWSPELTRSRGIGADL
jgi:pantothenate kinase